MSSSECRETVMFLKEHNAEAKDLLFNSSGHETRHLKSIAKKLKEKIDEINSADMPFFLSENVDDKLRNEAISEVTFTAQFVEEYFLNFKKDKISFEVLQNKMRNAERIIEAEKQQEEDLTPPPIEENVRRQKRKNSKPKNYEIEVEDSRKTRHKKRNSLDYGDDYSLEKENRENINDSIFGGHDKDEYYNKPANLIEDEKKHERHHSNRRHHKTARKTEKEKEREILEQIENDKKKKKSRKIKYSEERSENNLSDDGNLISGTNKNQEHRMKENFRDMLKTNESINNLVIPTEDINKEKSLLYERLKKEEDNHKGFQEEVDQEIRTLRDKQKKITEKINNQKYDRNYDEPSRYKKQKDLQTLKKKIREINQDFKKVNKNRTNIREKIDIFNDEFYALRKRKAELSQKLSQLDCEKKESLNEKRDLEMQVEFLKHEINDTFNKIEVAKSTSNLAIEKYTEAIEHENNISIDQIRSNLEINEKENFLNFNYETKNRNEEKCRGNNFPSRVDKDSQNKTYAGFEANQNQNPEFMTIFTRKVLNMSANLENPHRIIEEDYHNQVKNTKYNFNEQTFQSSYTDKFKMKVNMTGLETESENALMGLNPENVSRKNDHSYIN